MLSMLSMTVVMLSTWVNDRGERVQYLFDYADEFGGRGFKKTLPDWHEMKMYDAFDAYVKSFNEPALPPKTKGGAPRVIVESDEAGKPTYSTYDPKWDTETKQDLVRDVMKHAYGTSATIVPSASTKGEVTASATGSNKGVPWTKLNEYPDNFIAKEYLPSSMFRWKDPSHLTVDNVSVLLMHWDARRRDGKSGLEFKEVWHKKAIVAVSHLSRLREEEEVKKKQKRGEAEATRKRKKNAQSQRKAAGRPGCTRADRSDEETDEELPQTTPSSPHTLRPQVRKNSIDGNAARHRDGEDPANRGYESSGNSTEDEYIDPSEQLAKTSQPQPLTARATDYIPEMPGQLWGAGKERVMDRNEVFPISALPPTPSECPQDHSAQMSFIQKLFSDKTYISITVALEHGGHWPSSTFKCPAPTGKFAFISWEYAEPWIPMEFWLDVKSMHEMEEWCRQKPWLKDDGDLIHRVGVWSVVRALGMIGQEIWLKCLSDALPDEPGEDVLGEHYPFDTDQALTVDDTTAWANFLQIQLDTSGGISLSEGGHAVEWHSGAPSHDRRESLADNDQDDMDKDEIARAECHPEWATWEHSDTWTSRPLYTSKDAIPQLLKWMSFRPWRSYGGTSVGFTRISQVLLAVGMLQRELCLYRHALMAGSDFISWNQAALGIHFPKHLKNRAYRNHFDTIEKLLEDVYPQIKEDLTRELMFMEEEEAAARERDGFREQSQLGPGTQAALDNEARDPQPQGGMNKTPITPEDNLRKSLQNMVSVSPTRAETLTAEGRISSGQTDHPRNHASSGNWPAISESPDLPAVAQATRKGSRPLAHIRNLPAGSTRMSTPINVPQKTKSILKGPEHSSSPTDHGTRNSTRGLKHVRFAREVRKDGENRKVASPSGLGKRTWDEVLNSTSQSVKKRARTDDVPDGDQQRLA
ncbi:hypothetical protein EVG20_g9826 [Dentipellis fragilis]|uniref:Uncharacterized protein n=1 Tax=Dentipellis fragilis TaxID=205917 RepID=A0A4Y9XVP4_9AGAM|nr:hypothetical protein EVG20_g9826 [Dentipellis fragilis]